MAKILLGVIAVIACAMLAESLTCNKCSARVLGICIDSSTQTCLTNTSSCITSTASKSQNRKNTPLSQRF